MVQNPVLNIAIFHGAVQNLVTTINLFHGAGNKSFEKYHLQGEELLLHVIEFNISMALDECLLGFDEVL